MITSSLCDDRPTSLFSALLLCKFLFARMTRGEGILVKVGFWGKSMDRGGDEGGEERGEDAGGIVKGSDGMTL